MARGVAPSAHSRDLSEIVWLPGEQMHPSPPSVVPSSGRLLKRRSIQRYDPTQLLVVLTAIGIITLIALPQIHPGTARVDSAVQSLATTLYAARREAVTHRHDVAIAFDQAHRRALLLY